MSAVSSSEDDEEHFIEDQLTESDEQGDENELELTQARSKQKKTLEDLIEPMSQKLLLEREFRKLEYISALFGSGSRRINRYYRAFARFIWLTSLVIHFSFDVNECIRLYGYTFLAAQMVWLLNFIVVTWGTCNRVLPWLREGLRQLRRDQSYEKTITKVLEMMKVQTHH